MKRLYRSRSERVIAGVAGGLGRYLNIDPMLVRLFFVLLALSDGIGVLLYLVLAIIMPEAPEGAGEPLEGELEDITETEHERSSTVIGGGLILLGLFFLMQSFNISFIPWFSFEELWPLLLIVAGGALLWRQHQEQRAGG